jgi:hypothetical protein
MNKPVYNMNPEDLLDNNGEVVVSLGNMWALRSGTYDSDAPYLCGDYVCITDGNGDEYLYWDSSEWRDDPALVMGAIINTMAGLRLVNKDE